MSNSNGVISAPVSIDDVKTVLGESSNDLATLCKSSNINMWAKYKPVDYSADFMDIKSCYKGKAENFNINYPVSTTIKGVISYYSQTNNGWSYQTVSAPYRLGDFVGYNHNAQAFVKKFYADANPTTDNVGLNINTYVASTSSDNLGLEDFFNVNNYYLGVILSKNGTDVNYYKTDTQLSGITVGSVVFTSVSAGTYLAYPFMSSVDYSSNTVAEKVGEYIPLPGASSITVKVAKAAGKVTMSVDSALGRVSVVNNDSSSHVISVVFRLTTNKPTDAMELGEFTLIDNVTLASGGTKTAKYTTKIEESIDYNVLLYVDKSLTDTIYLPSSV